MLVITVVTRLLGMRPVRPREAPCASPPSPLYNTIIAATAPTPTRFYRKLRPREMGTCPESLSHSPGSSP